MSAWDCAPRCGFSSRAKDCSRKYQDNSGVSRRSVVGLPSAQKSSLLSVVKLSVTTMNQGLGQQLHYPGGRRFHKCDIVGSTVRKHIMNNYLIPMDMWLRSILAAYLLRVRRRFSQDSLKGKHILEETRQRSPFGVR